MKNIELIYNEIKKIINNYESSMIPIDYFLYRYINNNKIAYKVPRIDNNVVKEIDELLSKLDLDEKQLLFDFTVENFKHKFHYRHKCFFVDFVANVLNIKQEDHLLLVNSFYGLDAKEIFKNTSLKNATLMVKYEKEYYLAQMILSDYKNNRFINQNDIKDFRYREQLYGYNKIIFRDDSLLLRTSTYNSTNNEIDSEIDALINLLDYNEEIEKIAFIVNEKVLYDARFRDSVCKLIKSGHIEGIVSYHLGLKKVILILTKIYNEYAKIYYSNNNGNSDQAYLDYTLEKNDVIRLSIDELEKCQDLTPLKIISSYHIKEYLKDVKTVRLGDICDISIGTQYTPKMFDSRYEKIDKKNLGTTYALINPSDIDEDGQLFDVNNLQYYAIDKINKDRIANQGDILINSKSTFLKVCVLDGIDKTVNIIPTGGMFILRMKTRRISPYYLKAFFESNKGRELLSMCYKGNTIKVLTFKEFVDLEIPISEDLINQTNIQKEFINDYFMMQNLKRRLNEYRNKTKKLSNDVFDIKK